MNDIARGILGLPNPTPGPGALLGMGQIVAVGDTGFDMGSTTDVHPAFTGRVLKLYPLGEPPQTIRTARVHTFAGRFWETPVPQLLVYTHFRSPDTRSQPRIRSN